MELYKKEEHFVGYVLTLETGWTFGSEVITIQVFVLDKRYLKLHYYYELYVLFMLIRKVCKVYFIKGTFRYFSQ